MTAPNPLPSVNAPRLVAPGGWRAWVQAHALSAYFLLAFAGTWLVISPLVLAGVGLIDLPDAAVVILFILATYAGPALAASVVAAVSEGRAGLGRLLRRCVRWRVGVQWYALAVFAFLAVWLLAYSSVYAGAPLLRLVQNWSLLFSVFVPNLLIGLFIPSFGEEPGWRGFALPRLQARYGPAVGTVILGTLHGLWHLPAFFTPLLGPFSLERVVPFILTAIAGTFVYTWVFNNTRGSVLIAVVMHAASNAATNLMTPLVADLGPLAPWLEAGWLNVIAFGLTALVLLGLTGGRLSYPPAEDDSLPTAHQAPR